MIRIATGIFAALVLVAAPASAATWIAEGGTIGTGGPFNATGEPVSITQNTDATVVDDMVACANASCTPDGVVTCTTENSWGRLYNLDDDHGLLSTFAVVSLDMGHLTAIHELGESMTLEINLYEVDEADSPIEAGDPSASIGLGALVPIGSASIQVPGDGSAAGTFETIPVAGTVANSGTTDLFVEQFAPMNGTVGPFFAYRVGGNALGESWDGYLASGSCGIVNPTPFDFVGAGFPGIHLVQVVNGKEPPTPTEPVSWSEIKSLYQ